MVRSDELVSDADLGKLVTEVLLVIAQKHQARLVSFESAPGADSRITRSDFKVVVKSTNSLHPLGEATQRYALLQGKYDVGVGNHHHELFTVLLGFSEEIPMPLMKAVKDAKNHAQRVFFDRSVHNV